MKTEHKAKIATRTFGCFLVLLLLLLSVACGNGESNGNTQSDSQNTQSGTVPTEELCFKIADGEPQVKCTAEFNGDGSISSIEITDAETGQRIQTISMPDNKPFGKKTMYSADVTFTGEQSLLVSNYDSAYFVKFYAFRWDKALRQFVTIDGFENISNPRLDIENKEIYSHRSGDHITNYFIYSYSGSTLIPKNGLVWYPDGNETDAQSIHFIEYGENCKVINEFYLPLDENFDFDRENELFTQYTNENSFWDINGEKWDFQYYDKIYSF